jgi:hypothetical protein
MYPIENTPLRMFGLSHFIVLQKPAVAGAAPTAPGPTATETGR